MHTLTHAINAIFNNNNNKQQILLKIINLSNYSSSPCK